MKVLFLHTIKRAFEHNLLLFHSVNHRLGQPPLRFLQRTPSTIACFPPTRPSVINISAANMATQEAVTFLDDLPPELRIIIHEMLLSDEPNTVVIPPVAAHYDPGTGLEVATVSCHPTINGLSRKVRFQYLDV